MRPDLVPDLIIVGGGLSGGLLAWRLAMLRPEIRVLVLEAGGTLGGNHTWSFHDTDLSAAQLDWMAPLVAWRWPGYAVRFPELERVFAGGYASVTSARFDAVVRPALGPGVRCGVTVAGLAPDTVRLADGGTIAAGAVLDARGPGMPGHGVFAWQRFLGREVRLARPHLMDRPLLMDATVTQIDGFRFVYVLPFGPETALVEDTTYADSPGLDEAALRGRIDAWMAQRGWQVREVLREESGVLPIVLAGRPVTTEVPRIGLAGLLCHPTTGYALPDAVRLADAIAALPVISARSLRAAVDAHAVRAWRSQGMYRLLNRMLFHAAAPEERHRVLARFHRLPAGLVARFYAGTLRPGDHVRLLLGRPPVPLLPAARAALRLR
jgi:lycopene beta-cyclase